MGYFSFFYGLEINKLDCLSIFIIVVEIVGHNLYFYKQNRHLNSNVGARHRQCIHSSQIRPAIAIMKDNHPKVSTWYHKPDPVVVSSHFQFNDCNCIPLMCVSKNAHSLFT